MTIEQFSRDDFECVLTDARFSFDNLGYIGGELCYHIRLDDQSGIRIRSSIHADGQAAETGKDSIRAWLVGSNAQPLASKEITNSERWVTRVPGWQVRLIATIDRLRDFRQVLGNCRTCGAPNQALVSHTPKNPGRKFTKCSKCGQWGTWLSDAVIDKQMAIAELETERNEANAHGFGFTASQLQDEIESLEKPTETPQGFGITLATDLIALAETEEPKPVIVKEFKPSKYQADFYQALQGDDNIVLIAGPGTGKTTTIKNAAPYLPQKAKVVAVAFNKKNAMDLQSVMPDWVQCMTLHSLGLKAITKAWGKVTVEDRKVYNLLREYHDDAIYDNAPAINQLVALCKNTLTEPTPENLDQLCNYYGVDVDGDTQIIYRTTASVFEESRQQKNIIDYNDMPYYPGSGQVPCEKFDRVLIDETQDLNNTQIQQCLKSVASDGHIYAVGDPRQSLYGFRAADVDAVEKVTTALNAITLPLSISYRLPRSHVDQLNRLFPDAQIEARENAPAGIIADVASKDLFQKVNAGDMVICRTNAPLIEPCFELIRRGIKATIAGRDIGKNLITLLRKMAKHSMSQDLQSILYTLQEHVSREVPKLIMAHKENQALSLSDSAETIMALSENCQSVLDVEKKIESVFSDNVQGVVFSSCHRAKGLESEQVFLLHRELIPHPMARQVWQIKQEKNCLFVALSRSKNALYFVNP